jgi:hypothetical protein
MGDETKAGALLLSQIGMFNEAVVHWENVVQPKILGAMDTIVEKFAVENGWDSKCDFEKNYDCWIAPTSWRLAGQDEDPDHKAWFYMDDINTSDDFWIATYCGQGQEGGEAGFIFDVDAKMFNGQRAWNAYATKIGSELVKALEKNNYKDLGKGKFLLPIHLDPEQLAKAWEIYGADDSKIAEDECFDPVRTALKTIEDSVSIFDRIMEDFSSN